MWCSRFSIAGVHAVFLWLLFSIPNSDIRTQEGGVQSAAVGGLLFSVVLALVALLLVQASDPGYLSVGTVGTERERESSSAVCPCVCAITVYSPQSLECVSRAVAFRGCHPNSYQTSSRN